MIPWPGRTSPTAPWGKARVATTSRPALHARRTAWSPAMSQVATNIYYQTRPGAKCVCHCTACVTILCCSCFECHRKGVDNRPTRNNGGLSVATQICKHTEFLSVTECQGLADIPNKTLATPSRAQQRLLPVTSDCLGTLFLLAQINLV